MIKAISIGIISLVTLVGSWFGVQQLQLAGPVASSHTSLLPFVDSTYYIGTSSPSLLAWANGFFDQLCLAGDCRTSWPTGGGGGSGTVSTSTNETAGRLPYWTSNSGTPALLGEVATGTISAGAGISLDSAVRAAVGGSLQITNSSPLSNLAASFPFSFSSPTLSWIGLATTSNPTAGNIFYSNGTNGLIPIATSSINVGTASALLANGANCSSGNAPLGVDASGAVESCFDVWTEAENTTAGYVASTRSLTVAGTANQITSSAGAQDLSADRTWTLSLPSFVQFPGTASTSALTVTGSATSTFLQGNIDLFGMLGIGKTATTTIRGDLATSTFSQDLKARGITLSGFLEFGGVAGTAWTDFCTTITGGSGLCDGVDASGSGSGSGNVATSTNETKGRLPYWTSTSGTPATVGEVSTTTLTFSSFPANLSASIGALVGGNNATWTWWGLSTTSQPSSSNLLVSNGTNGVYGVATGTISAGTGISLDSSVRAAIGGALQITNSGVTSNVAGTGITVSGATGAVTITATDVNKIATTTDIAVPQVAYFTKVSGLTTVGSVATGTLTATSPLSLDNARSVLGGSAALTLGTVGYANGGTGTTTAPSGWVLYGGGNGVYQARATTTVTCAGTASCTTFDILGSSPITITGSGGGGSGTVSTSTNETAGQLAYWTSNSGTPALLGQVATGTISSANTALTVTGSRYAVGGAALFTVSTTTTTMFTGSQGQVLGYTASGWTGLATTTFSSPLIYAAGNVTCQTASGSLAGCLSSADWTTFNSKLSSYDAWTHNGGLPLKSATTSIIGIGTTTPQYSLTVASSTGAQLALVDGSLTSNHWVFRNKTSNLYISTSSPSTFATSTIAALTITSDGNLGIGTTSPFRRLGVQGGAWFSGDKVHIGSALSNEPNDACAGAITCLEVVGNDNTNVGTIIGVENINAGASAYAGYNILNNMVGSNTSNYSGIWTNSSVYNDTTFGAASNFPNLMVMQNTMGNIALMASSTGVATSSNIRFFLQGVRAADEVMRITNYGAVGIGTTTPRWGLTIASSTRPQLTLTDGSLTSTPWNFRSQSGNLMISTSTASTFATTTTSALTILGTGGRNLGVATTSFNGDVGIGPVTANGSTTISVGKLQWDGYDTGGTRRCVFINAAGTLTVQSGACSP